MCEIKVLEGLFPFRGSRGDFIPCLSQLLVVLPILVLSSYHCNLCICGHSILLWCVFSSVFQSQNSLCFSLISVHVIIFRVHTDNVG